jgi:hypothetical protein
MCPAHAAGATGSAGPLRGLPPRLPPLLETRTRTRSEKSLKDRELQLAELAELLRARFAVLVAVVLTKIPPRSPHVPPHSRHFVG